MMANDITTTLTDRIAGFKSFSIALDGSTDLSDKSQLAIFIRGVDKEFTATEALLALQPLQGTTTREDIFNEVQKICSRIDAKDVYVDLSSILISHLKEYRKALKRHEKLATGTVESHYKKRHLAAESNKKYDSAEHCTNILRVVLKELESWELWDTPHSELLVRILSKRLNNFIESTLIDPNWLNTQLITFFIGQPIEIPKEILKFNEMEKMASEDVTDKKFKEQIIAAEQLEVPKSVRMTTIESALSNLITKSTAPILQRALANEMHIEDGSDSKGNDVEDIRFTVPVDIKCSPILRQRRGRQGKNEVKIYDRIVEGTVKTWETDMDLQCISLGQDLLASLDGEITLSRLWEQDVETDTISPQSSNIPSQAQALWFGEEDSLDMELNSESASPPKKEPSPMKKDHSPKPTEALLKDIQSTVNQAKTKIGDLQVALEYSRNLDVSSRNQSATGVC
ncbi:General transcription factor II-I repeat domain-containing protein 2A [Eumeta japonica]|uniref:General transcription factor II-I repeat domain-containing protein 2A n=1 Tax=Eumeta variegata TaxID=151549 RepID=A0A4C1ZAQ8_EUMVA|nr:General transcription factor II-I repeat domain-containing protein 2A [Eumeta japonica]